MRDCGALWPQWASLSGPSLQASGIYETKKEWVWEPEVMEHFKKKMVSSRHSRAGAHLDSRRPWQHAWDLYRFKLGHIPAQKRGMCVCGGGDLAFVIGSHPPTQTHKPQNVIQKPLFGLGLWLTLVKKWLRRCHCDSCESILFGTLFPCDQIGSHLAEAERPQGTGEAETAKDYKSSNDVRQVLSVLTPTSGLSR